MAIPKIEARDAIPAFFPNDPQIFSTADTLIKEKKYLLLFQTLTKTWLTNEHNIKRLAEKLTQLSLAELAESPDIHKNYRAMLEQHVQVFSLEIFQKYLINQLKDAQSKNNDKARVFCLQLIMPIDKTYLRTQLEKTKDQALWNMINNFASLRKEGVIIQLKEKITVTSKETTPFFKEKIKSFLTENNFNLESLNLEGDLKKNFTT